jgi:hypothetical protein
VVSQKLITAPAMTPRTKPRLVTFDPVFLGLAEVRLPALHAQSAWWSPVPFLKQSGLRASHLWPLVLTMGRG